MSTRNRFQRGSGCFRCHVCKCLTRSTGRGDNELVGECEDCYDLGGVENTISDSGSTPELEAEAEALRQRIAERKTREAGRDRRNALAREKNQILRDLCGTSARAARRDMGL